MRRARQLHQTADRQIADLADSLSRASRADLERPCLGRAMLGDGTLRAVADHAIDNYGRIADFVAPVQDGTARPGPGRHGKAQDASDVELDVVLLRLESTRNALTRIARLSDDQLDSVPTPGLTRFADGQRTLEQVMASLLKHQRHQVDAIAAAVS